MKKSFLEDNLFTNIDPDTLGQVTASVMEGMEAKAAGTPYEDIFTQLTEAGSFMDVLDLDENHVEALLAQAGQLIAAGAPTQARDLLLAACLLDPSEARAIYAMAGTYHMEKRFDAAGLLYAQYILQRKDDPDGYLRLGDCLLGDGSLDDAREAYDNGLDTANEQNLPEAAAYAKAMLERIDAAKAAQA